MVNNVVNSGLFVGDRIVKIRGLVGWIANVGAMDVVEHLNVGGWDFRFDVVVLLRSEVEMVVFDLDSLWNVGHCLSPFDRSILYS